MPALIKCLQHEAKTVNAEPRCQFNCCVTLRRLLNFFAFHLPQFFSKTGVIKCIILMRLFEKLDEIMHIKTVRLGTLW